MNRHTKFWLTSGNILTMLYLLIMIIIFTNCDDDYVKINKIYVIPALPLLIFNCVQFMLNYISLTEE